MGIKVEIIAHTPEPELTVAIAARACIEDLDQQVIRCALSRADVARIIATVVAKGHHSVLEHANFTFAISGVSRVLSHQLVRHRIASYSQLSQQRSNAGSLDFVVPPEIKRHPDLAREYEELMKKCQTLYEELVIHGISLGSARYALPSSFTTRIVMTMNARSLLNLISQRACAAEEWEFRQLAMLMHREVMRIAPLIFQFAGTACESTGVCPEGEVGLQCAKLRRTGATVSNTREQIHAMLHTAV